MFENPRRGRQARNFTTNAPKILDLKSSSEQIFSRKLPLGAPDKIGVKTPLISGLVDSQFLRVPQIPDPERQNIPRIPCPNFGESHFPGSSQIPFPIKIFCVFLNPAVYFIQIPDPENT